MHEIPPLPAWLRVDPKLNKESGRDLSCCGEVNHRSGIIGLA